MARRGLFGSVTADTIMPGESDGIPQQMPNMPIPDNAAPSGGAKWVGIIADTLAGLNGQQGMFAPMWAQQAQSRQNAAARQSQEWQDWVAKRQYDAAHPQPTTLEQNVAAWQRLTPEQRDAYAQYQEANQGPVTLTLPGDRIYSGPRSGLATALGAQPQTVQNTPAPTLGANGMPQSLSPEQYAAVEASMGKERTAQWAARNRIPISKTVGGQTYYQVNGEWYDNPEGR